MTLPLLRYDAHTFRFHATPIPWINGRATTTFASVPIRRRAFHTLLKTSGNSGRRDRAGLVNPPFVSYQDVSYRITVP
jgi:hypothetical protein